MITRKRNFLSDVIRNRWFFNFSKRGFKRSASRRNGNLRPVSAQIDTLEQRTLLTANPIAGQFLVNETLELEESPPAVPVVESTGNFVAAWTSFEQTGGDESGLGVYVQRFLANGDPADPMGGPILVNADFTAGDQLCPSKL